MKVAFIDTVHPVLWDRLIQAGYHCQHMEHEPPEKVIPSLKAFDGLVIRSRFKLNKEVLQQAPNLKFIARSGAGMENIDTQYCKENNIQCFNSPEGNQQAVAEHALGMLLMLFNQLKKGDYEVRNGVWNREDNRGVELAGKTVGLVGYGYMGSAFAKVLSGIGCKVIAYDKYKAGFSDKYVEECSLTTLYEQTDVLSLHLPLSEETRYWLNADRITKFKKPLTLINTARGQQVHTKDLVEALKNGVITGACLDVLEYEKSSFEKLSTTNLPAEWQYIISSEKVILSPHVAGWTKESYVKLSEVLADKIIMSFNK